MELGIQDFSSVTKFDSDYCKEKRSLEHILEIMMILMYRKSVFRIGFALYDRKVPLMIARRSTR